MWHFVVYGMRHQIIWFTQLVNSNLLTEQKSLWSVSESGTGPLDLESSTRPWALPIRNGSESGSMYNKKCSLSNNWRRVCSSTQGLVVFFFFKTLSETNQFVSVFLFIYFFIMIAICICLLMTIRSMPICTFIEFHWSMQTAIAGYCLIAIIPANWSPTRIILNLWYDYLPLIEANSTINIHNNYSQPNNPWKCTIFQVKLAVFEICKGQSF